MLNTVFLNKDGYIEQIYKGDQNSETVILSVERVNKLIEKLKSEGKPIKVLVNLSQIKNTDAGSREAAVDALKKWHFDKTALYGGSVFIKNLANLIIRAARKQDKVKIFDERKEAVKWLG